MPEGLKLALWYLTADLGKKTYTTFLKASNGI